MDSITDILDEYSFAEPDEIEAIKKFVKDKYGDSPGVRVSGEQIIISVHSAALASAIRSNWSELTSAVKTDKKIMLRIA